MDSFKTASPSGTTPSDPARGSEALLAERMTSAKLTNKPTRLEQSRSRKHHLRCRGKAGNTRTKPSNRMEPVSPVVETPTPPDANTQRV